MSRLFDGSDDVMTFARPSSNPTMNDALTMLVVLRIMNASDNTFQSYMEFDRSSGGQAAGLIRSPGATVGQLTYVNTNGSSWGSTEIGITDADGWMVLAITRSTAAATTMYKIPIGGSTTTFAGTALADGLGWDTNLDIGGDEDFANFRLAAAAYWAGTALTQAQIEGVAAAATTQSIADLSPLWLADDSDAFATNLVDPGNGDRSAIVGTADDADDPSGWVYGLGGAAGPSQRFMWMP